MTQACPMCDGAKFLGGGNELMQPCPLCDATGVDPGVEVFRVYIFDISLTALQRLDNQRVVIDGTAAFRLKALAGTQTGTYRIRFRHASGEYMSSGGTGGTNDLVNNGNMIGTAQFPFPVIPQTLYGPNGHILIDIADLSNANNTIQIAFIGANVYPNVAAEYQS